MKKIILLALAVILVIGLFAGCSANGSIDTEMTDGYSNVSTTRDGRVNGTNNQTARRTTPRNTKGVGVEGHIGIGRMS